MRAETPASPDADFVPSLDHLFDEAIQRMPRAERANDGGVTRLAWRLRFRDRRNGSGGRLAVGLRDGLGGRLRVCDLGFVREWLFGHVVLAGPESDTPPREGARGGLVRT
jgi:hypothetical protein